jgi:hypothetical protein
MASQPSPTCLKTRLVGPLPRCFHLGCFSFNRSHALSCCNVNTWPSWQGWGSESASFIFVDGALGRAISSNLRQRRSVCRHSTVSIWRRCGTIWFVVSGSSCQGGTGRCRRAARSFDHRPAARPPARPHRTASGRAEIAARLPAAKYSMHFVPCCKTPQNSDRCRSGAESLVSARGQGINFTHN